MYCPNCGTELKGSNYNYCEFCGEKLKDEESNEVATTPKETRNNTSLSLFDVNRNYYVLKEKYWDWGSGDILDENGKIIGRMNRKIFNIRKKIELLEMNGVVAATIHEKIVSARGAQDLKDPNGLLIARIKKKITSVFRPLFWLEDPGGNRWYEAQGEFMGWSYKIRELSTGKVVAEIEKADRWRDIFLGGLFDFKDTYALKILDNETDRRILLGFVLSIDNVLHDNRHGPFGRPGWIPFPHRHPRKRFPGGGGWPF
ncbi:MAG: hypothetical protein GF317_07325 [Candidatus Lokiarchaeota archaeon]|nr:hypothetical protein [Candidatus Lokiarchaeota archaeon]MBD3199519.1 hypothetical protein [Candidatus Lokiarchaeota archaeon]